MPYITQLDTATRQLREQLSHQQNLVRPHAADDAGAVAPSKLEAILEQTLQMQSMFMTHMTAQGLGDRATSVAPANVSPDAQPAVHGASHDALLQKPVLAGRGGEAAAVNHPEAAKPMPSKQAEAIAARAAAAAAAYASQVTNIRQETCVRSRPTCARLRTTFSHPTSLSRFPDFLPPSPSLTLWRVDVSRTWD